MAELGACIMYSFVVHVDERFLLTPVKCSNAKIDGSLRWLTSTKCFWIIEPPPEEDADL